MNRTAATLVIIMWLVVTITLVTTLPTPFSDKNNFLKGFVNHELLSFMGIIVTITLASAANIYIELNKLEEQNEKLSFVNTKNDLKHSSYALIICLISALIISIIKPWASQLGDRADTLSNCIALGIIVFAFMIMIDLIETSFSIKNK